MGGVGAVAVVGLIGLWGMAEATVGAVIAWRRPENRIGRLLQVGGPLIMAVVARLRVRAIGSQSSDPNDTLGALAGRWASGHRPPSRPASPDVPDGIDAGWHPFFALLQRGAAAGITARRARWRLAGLALAGPRRRDRHSRGRRHCGRHALARRSLADNPLAVSFALPVRCARRGASATARPGWRLLLLARRLALAFWASSSVRWRRGDPVEWRRIKSRSLSSAGWGCRALSRREAAWTDRGANLLRRSHGAGTC